MLLSSRRLLLLLVLVVFVVTVFVGADEDDEHYITCGSFIKIQHKDTEYYLNSEEKSLGGSGHGQQIVTFVKDKSTHNTLWWIRPAHHKKKGEYPKDVATCSLAEPVKCGSTVRLTHQDTLRNLHSHHQESALSRQQEITGFGTGDGKGDNGDNWILECTSKDAKLLKRGGGFRLKHVDTQRYLGTSKKVEFNQNTCGHNCPIMGHLEAFGRAAADAYTIFKSEEGIHLSK